MLVGISIQTIINKISIAVILLVVVLFLVDKSFLGVRYMGVIPFVCFVLVINYVSHLLTTT